jgi:hypothetical protein
VSESGFEEGRSRIFPEAYRLLDATTEDWSVLKVLDDAFKLTALSKLGTD